MKTSLRVLLFVSVMYLRLGDSYSRTVGLQAVEGLVKRIVDFPEVGMEDGKGLPVRAIPENGSVTVKGLMDYQGDKKGSRDDKGVHFSDGIVNGDFFGVQGITSFEDINREKKEKWGSTPEIYSRLEDVQNFFGDKEEGRHMKKKKMMMRMAAWLQTLALGVVLPVAVALAHAAAWKGITISLMALLLASIVGLKGLVASASKSSSGGPHYVVVSGLPSHHQHHWKRSDVISDAAWEDSTHHLAYRAYT